MVLVIEGVQQHCLFLVQEWGLFFKHPLASGAHQDFLIETLVSFDNFKVLNVALLLANILNYLRWLAVQVLVKVLWLLDRSTELLVRVEDVSS